MTGLHRYCMYRIWRWFRILDDEGAKGFAVTALSMSSAFWLIGAWSISNAFWGSATLEVKGYERWIGLALIGGLYGIHSLQLRGANAAFDALEAAYVDESRILRGGFAIYMCGGPILLALSAVATLLRQSWSFGT